MVFTNFIDDRSQVFALAAAITDGDGYEHIEVKALNKRHWIFQPNPNSFAQLIMRTFKVTIIMYVTYLHITAKNREIKILL